MVLPREIFLTIFLSKETRTPLFDRLFDFRDIWFSKSPFKISLEEKIDLTLEKFCSLYNQRGHVQRSIADWFHNILDDPLLINRRKKSDDKSLKEGLPVKTSELIEDATRYFRLKNLRNKKLFLKALMRRI